MAELVGLLVSRCLYWARLGVFPSSNPATCTLKRISWASALPLYGPTRREQWLVSGWNLWGKHCGKQKKKKKISDTQVPRDLLISKNLGSSTSCKTQLLKVSRNLKCYSITKTLFPIYIYIYKLKFYYQKVSINLK